MIVSVLALYLASRFKTLPWTTRNPRYLLPLYTATPYLLACAARTVGRRRATAACRAETIPDRAAHASVRTIGAARRLVCPLCVACALAAAVAINVYGNAQYADLPSTAMPRVAPLVARLLARRRGGVRRLLGRLAARLHQWRAADPRPNRRDRGGSHPRGARYPPVWAQAARARRWAYILPSREVPALTALLRRAHIPFAQRRWGTSSLFFNHWVWSAPTVVDGPVRAGFPPDVGGQPSLAGASLRPSQQSPVCPVAVPRSADERSPWNAARGVVRGPHPARGGGGRST